MLLHFTKMHGLVNDYILIDATQKKIELSPQIIQKLADRHTGIGFDQLLILEACTEREYDFIYRIFNANGQEVEQCGNGARCAGHYIFSEKLTKKKKVTLKTIAGPLEIHAQQANQIKVNMGFPQLAPAQIPLVMPHQALLYQIFVADTQINFGAVALGNPHAIVRVNDVKEAPTEEVGALFQHHPIFPKQVNVGFMEIISPDYIKLRVYERGVGETQACGSGACAAVVIGKLCYALSSKVTVELPGGNLIIAWESPCAPVYMTGPAEKVYRGNLRLTV